MNIDSILPISLAATISAPIGEDAVHVVEIALPEKADALAEAEAVLVMEERNRAHRMAPQARRQYVAGRMALRYLLSCRTRIHPSRVVLSRDPHGRPASPGASLTFNVAHAGSWILLAFAGSREVGVDVEESFTVADYATAARKILNLAEKAFVEALPIDRRPEQFQRYWVLKEAVMKARGLGFSSQPATINVDLAGRGGVPTCPGYAVQEWAIDRTTRAAAALAGERPTRLIRHQRFLPALLEELSHIDDRGARQ